MFYSIEDIIQQSKNYKSVAELMIATEIELTGRSREQIIALMKKNLDFKMEQHQVNGNQKML